MAQQIQGTQSHNGAALVIVVRQHRGHLAQKPSRESNNQTLVRFTAHFVVVMLGHYLCWMSGIPDEI